MLPASLKGRKLRLRDFLVSQSKEVAKRGPGPQAAC